MNAFIGLLICVLGGVVKPGDVDPIVGPTDKSHVLRDEGFFERFSGVSVDLVVLHVTVIGEDGRSNGIVERKGRNGINGSS